MCFRGYTVRREIMLRAHTIVQWRIQEFCSGGGVQQIQLKTEDREDGDMGGCSPP